MINLDLVVFLLIEEILVLLYEPAFLGVEFLYFCDLIFKLVVLMSNAGDFEVEALDLRLEAFLVKFTFFRESLGEIEELIYLGEF